MSAPAPGNTDTMHDVRFAIRQLLKAPAFASIAILSLGLGIGACSMVFSWIQGVLIDTVPGARDPGQLVVLCQRQASGKIHHTLSWLDRQDLGAETGLFDGVIGSQMEAVSLRVDRENEWIWAQVTTANYFEVLGVSPVIGRGFRPDEDDAPGGNAVAVISHALWQRRFGGDRGVLGRTIEIARRPFTVIGVAPADFRGTMGGLGFDVWVPVTMSNEHDDLARALNSRSWRWLHTMARLKDGVTRERAQAAVNTVMRRAEAAYPDSNRNVGVAVLPVWKSPYGAQSLLLPLLVALAGTAVLLLLLVIANVANLLLARATAREGEMAVRVAIGAGARRLMRQILVESLVLAALGGALGCLLAAALGRSLLWLMPSTYLPIRMDFHLDGRVLAFTALTTLAAGILFGLAPAWRAVRANIAEALRAGGRSGDGSRHSQRARQALVVVEVAAALMLLIGMMLCARSFDRARLVYVGLEPRNVWLAGFRLPQGSYTLEQARDFYRRLRHELVRLPGATSVALSDWLPLGFEGGSSTGIRVPGYTPAPGESVETAVSAVSAGYFATLKIPILGGREFDERDHRESPPVVVINEQLARRYFGDRDPLGQELWAWGSQRRIVGIARTGKYLALNEPPQPYLYIPVEQTGDHTLTAIVRTEGNPASIATAVERTAAAIDPSVKPMAAMPMTEFMAPAYLIPRTAAVLLAILGATALLLATMGIYGVIAASVGRRIREVGVRMALGAARRDVALMFIRQGIRLVALGGLIGLIGALLGGRVLSSLLVDVSVFDPWTYAIALPALVLIGTVACWLPARRAATLDPIAALRTE